MGSGGQEFDSPPERTRALDPTVVDDRTQRQSTRIDAAGDRAVTLSLLAQFNSPRAK
jgi:hypothetical protein